MLQKSLTYLVAKIKIPIFAKNNYMLNYEDFYNYVWYQVISTKIVPTAFREKYKDFIHELTFNYYNTYDKLGSVHEKVFGKMLEATLSSVIKSEFCIDEYYEGEDEDDFNDAALGFYDV